MRYGYIRAAAAAPAINLAEPEINRTRILQLMHEAAEKNIELLVLPALCITGYTCGSLFLQRRLLSAAEDALLWLAEESRLLSVLTFVGVPLLANGKLYNCAAALYRGRITGIVPQTWLHEDEKRYFTSPREHNPGDIIMTGGRHVPFGAQLLWKHEQRRDIAVAAEIGRDLWAPIPPSSSHALAGATVIVNLSADSEAVGKAAYRRELVTGQSARLHCAYVYANTGEGESTSSDVFSGHGLIAENGRILSESPPFENAAVYNDIDTELLSGERIKNSTFINGGGLSVEPHSYRVIAFTTLEEQTGKLLRPIARMPFVPEEKDERAGRGGEVLNIQAAGLVRRLAHTKVSHVTLALSGGLDSTLALLVAVRAFDRLRYDRKGILALSMPGFGTSERTRSNASELARLCGASFKEINIKDAVTQHFKDIAHDPNLHDVVYENAQARERTQVAMDLGFMIGTGDLSELALGFSTYNGDHMSMYSLNASVPKTLMRHIILCEAESSAPELKKVLTDILNTPISPELLPPDPVTGCITQETESFVGPYELHDFFLFHMLRYGFSPEKIHYLANEVFAPDYDSETIKKWLRLFCRRFFSGQYKRACAPDGPRVGSVSLSPGGWHMPSDAEASAFLD